VDTYRLLRPVEACRDLSRPVDTMTEKLQFLADCRVKNWSEDDVSKVKVKVVSSEKKFFIQHNVGHS
jgi:hypothetical protein